MLEMVLAFFWYPDGPAPPLETESDAALSLGLLRVGSTPAVVGTEGLLVGVSDSSTVLTALTGKLYILPSVRPLT